MAETPVVYRALLIGNAEFPDEPALHRLRGPANDLPQLRAALNDPEAGLPWEVTSVLNGTAQQVQEALFTFFHRATAREQLLLYYSGHGRLDLHNRLHLCTHDTTLDWLRTRSVRQSYVTELMDDCAARAIVVVLDCCFSGRAATAKGGEAAARFAGRGRFVMTGCGLLETAADASGEDEPSPFTAALVAGLRHGTTGADGYVTVEDVYRYVDSRMRGSGQHPEMKAEGRAGHVALARRVGAASVEGTPDSTAVPGSPDLRPLFTDAHGVSERPRIESHFSGVLHVLLTEPAGTLTVHRDDLVAAGGDGERVVQGWWFAHGQFGIRRKPVRPTAITTPARDVRFELPDGAGTLVWSAEQLAAFDRARLAGRWPTATRPTLTEATHTVLKSRDPVYRRLTREAWFVLAALIGCAVSVSLFVWLLTAGGDGVWRGTTLVVLFLLAVFSLTLLSASAGVLWVFLRLRRFLRLPSLPVTPMLLKVHNPPPITGMDDAGLVTVHLKRSIVLWSEDLSLTLPHSYYANRVQRSDPPFSTGSPTPVEVIGLPAPGQWVVVRTPDGLLWPSGRAKSVSASTLAAVTGRS
ncbi:caspase domain-containing protein [Streptomyces sp. NPDC092369]|uniref:caspase family protein n=1 Tax=Streptomyces sp. NPDC092369 TaxID=3366015 RepID=UPI003822C799